ASVSTYRIVGADGSVRLDPAFEYAEGLRQFIQVEGEEEQVRNFPKRDQFAPELVYFSRCILDDEEPEPSGEEGLADVRVLQAVIESASSGVPVNLPPMR